MSKIQEGDRCVVIYTETMPDELRQQVVGHFVTALHVSELIEGNRLWRIRPEIPVKMSCGPWCVSPHPAMVTDLMEECLQPIRGQKPSQKERLPDALRKVTS